MDFDWSNPAFKLSQPITIPEIEESFEDPFVVRLLPDSPRFTTQARYFNLGRSATGTGIFSVYRTNGRQVRVLFAREFMPEEHFFYKRRTTQLLDHKE